MRTEEKKKSQVKMNDVITLLGDVVASTGCRVFLYQPKLPEKLAEKAKNNRKQNN